MHRKYNLVSVKQISYGSTGRYSGMELIDRRHRYNSIGCVAIGGERQYFNFTLDDLIYSDNVNIE